MLHKGIYCSQLKDKHNTSEAAESHSLLVRRARAKRHHHTYCTLKLAPQHAYSMLIFIKLSLAFSMPMSPTLLGPSVGVMLKLILPPLFDRSPCD